MPIQGIQASAGMKPTTPTIGTATDGGTGTTVSVAFTPSTYIGKGTITYTATSSPGSLTATGSGSPITVSGLTTGTAYTFTVQGATNYGVNSDASAASNSVTPASPSSFESIATQTVSGSASSITFSSIPSTYKSLQIRGIAQFSGGGNGLVRFQFNGDTGTNYGTHYLQGNGTSVTAVGYASETGILSKFNNGSTNLNTSTFGAVIFDVIDYTSTSKNKTGKIICGDDWNSTSTNQTIMLSSGVWLNTSAVTSIRLDAGSFPFITGTTFALYGIKG